MDARRDPETRTAEVGRLTILTGVLASVLLAVGAIGAGGILVRDPLLSGTPLTWVRFGHGQDIMTFIVYTGLALLVWAWLRLGRAVLFDGLRARGVLRALAIWTAPVLIAPPLFSRDVYSYLAQGNLALHGLDPYQVGPSAAPGALADNVSWLWQNTPAPYGPLFVLVAKGCVWLTGQNLISGVLVMRLAMLVGLGLVCWSLPILCRHLGGRLSVALWLVAANPLILVHLTGGPHNDLLMIGLLACGVALALEGRHATGIAVVMLGAAVKATAVVAVPFLVWIWAARLTGTARSRFVRAAGYGTVTAIGAFGGCSVLAGVDLGWISALRDSSAIVNWLSAPTGLAQVAHWVVSVFTTAEEETFLEVGRTLGTLALAALAACQWWRARAGGPDAVRRAAITLFAVAALSPQTLPWYFSWALVLAAGLAWRTHSLVLATGASVWLLLVTFPTGASALYSWGFLVVATAVSVWAANRLTRPDEPRLTTGGLGEIPHPLTPCHLAASGPLTTPRPRSAVAASIIRPSETHGLSTSFDLPRPVGTQNGDRGTGQ